MIKKLLKQLYFTALGQLLSKFFNPLWRRFKAPLMLWGYRDASGTWRVRTRISDTVFLYHPERIYLDEDVFVWHYTILDGTGGLKIGRGSQIGACVGIFTHSSHQAIRLYGEHYSEVPEDEKVAFHIAPVNIGRYVFVGAGAKILPNVNIGDGVLVSAGAMVTKDVAAFQIVAGNPAKVIGDTRKIDAAYLAENPQLAQWYQDWQKATDN
jgi:acetyltransferase-like isoleucine patch superfamily enzyme